MDELAVTLTRSRWDASSLAGIMTEAFDCPPTLEVRLRRGNLTAVNPTLSVLGFTTAEWFWRAMPEVHFHGGLGNRFLYFTGTPGKPIAFPPKPDEAQVQAFVQQLDDADAIPVLDGPDLELALDDLSADVRGLWGQFYEAWTNTERGLPDLLAAGVKRLPSYAWKIALIYAYLERTLPAITTEQLMAAIEVVNFALASTRILMNHRGADTPQGRIEARVVKALQQKNLPLWKVHQGLGGDTSLEDIERAIRALERAHLVEIKGATSRHTLIWGLCQRPERSVRREA
jgi:hypothetical protein